MKNKLLLVASFIITFGFCKAQTLKNGALEGWNITPYEDPSGWFTANEELSRSGGLITVSKATGHNGNAVKLETKATTTDTFFGYFNATQGDPIAGQGGFSYSQKPDSITGYYQCNIGNGDSGIILIVFKKNGSVVSTDVFKFGGTQSTFKRFAFPLSLGIIPDSAIIASASSNAIDEIGILPGSTLTIDELAFTGTGITQAIPNGTFDAWVSKSYDVLADWDRGGSGVSRTTDSYKGSYAVLLETKDVGDNGANPSGITNGKYQENQGPKGGVPYTSMQDTLVFYYKYTPMGTDSALAFITLMSQGNPVGGNSRLLPQAASYTKIEIPFQAGMAPDTLRIEFMSSKYPVSLSNLGSKLYIDEVQLKSQPLNTGIVKPVLQTARVYPNPATESINIIPAVTLPNAQITLYDMPGKKVDSIAINGPFDGTTISVAHLQAGIYMYQIISNGAVVASGKFSKQ